MSSHKRFQQMGAGGHAGALAVIFTAAWLGLNPALLAQDQPAPEQAAPAPMEAAIEPPAAETPTPAATDGAAPAAPGEAPAALEAAEAPVDAEALTATIVALRGLVQVRDADDQPWRMAEVGMAVRGGAELRTGPRSAVQFRIPPGQLITLDRTGAIKLLQAIQQADGELRTELGMPYGRTRYDIKAPGVQHETTIRSPSATLAVRGSEGGIQEGPLGYLAWSHESRTLVHDPLRRKQYSFGPGSAVSNDTDGPAEQARAQATTDAGDAWSRDPVEAMLVAERPSGEFEGSSLQLADLRTALLDPVHDLGLGETNGMPEGALRFDFTWDPDTFVDIDFTLASPSSIPVGQAIAAFGGAELGEGFSLVGVLPDGGRFVANDFGEIDSASFEGSPGVERVELPESFALGEYLVGAVPFSYGDLGSVDYTIDVFVRSSETGQFELRGQLERTLIESQVPEDTRQETRITLNEESVQFQTGPIGME